MTGEREQIGGGNPLEELDRARAAGRLREDVDVLLKQMRGAQDFIRGKETPGGGIPTWGRRPAIRDSGRDERGDRSRVVSVAADEIYIHDEKSADQLAHELQHILIEKHPASDRGDDIVRRAPGHHITHTVGAHMVNSAGHLDVSKLGAAVGHAAPDQDGNEQAIGSTSVSDDEPKTTTSATVDGTKGLALTQVARIAFDPTETYPALYAFFRTEEADYKGHVEGVTGETKSAAVFTPPWGSAKNQMWLWGGASTEYETIAAPTASSQILIYAGGAVGWVASATKTVVTDYRLEGTALQKQICVIRIIDAAAATWVDAVAATNCPS